MPNRLTSETSLYLLQHADNPVDWQPWGEEALAEARARDCPVLLSIGYSACHWCHVMAHESFEDAITADQMNQCFVNIKVDREERPDLDQVYQLAHHILCQSPGGWPLTIFLNPHTLAPFFAGTYFPNKARYQRPSFIELLKLTADTWATQRKELDEQSSKLQAMFATLTAASSPQALDANSALTKTYDYLAKGYDAACGGFGDAPKFPMVTSLHFLLEYGRLQKKSSAAAIDMVMHSLTCMARGGIFDHIGGGFFRYSVDRQWDIPHFEKMLYDNSALLALYAKALSFAPNALFQTALQRTADWMLCEMQLPAGGFKASIDADSAEGEGSFYLWRKKEVATLLEAEEYLLIETLFGLDKRANFEGRWHLRRTDAWSSVVARLSMLPAAAANTLATALAKLGDARARRAAPTTDSKVICAWNGLAIKGMALASVCLARPIYMTSAFKALDFIRDNLYQDGHLCSIWDKDKTKSQGFLDDYACLLDAVLTLLACHWRPQDARFARRLADGALEFFVDKEQGGFFFVSQDQEPPLARLKPINDDMVPAGNGLMLQCLLKLGHLFSEDRYLDAADSVARSCPSEFAAHPAMSPQLSCALQEWAKPPRVVVMWGPEAMLSEWLSRCQLYPDLQSYAVPLEPQNQEHLPACLSGVEERAAADRTVQAFLCQGLSCNLPVTTLTELEALLAG